MLPIRNEYPRPQFVRSEWVNLNGSWQFELDLGNSGLDRKVWEKPGLDGTINVPFCPESRLSGVEHKDFIPACWYRRTFEVAEKWLEGRVLMHFGAVYYDCRIWINGAEIGHHRGGHSSFCFDVTDYVAAGENTVVVYAHSDVRSKLQPSGKQSKRYYSAGCDYTRTTGIWQTVWLEPVPASYVGKCFLTPDLANQCVHFRVEVKNAREGQQLRLEAGYEGKGVGSACVKVSGGWAVGSVSVSELHLWELGQGRLYDLKIALEKDEAVIDKLDSYFGMRCVELDGKVFKLNGKPVYMRTVLDQGFNPEGIITPPSDEFQRMDIVRSMAAGFNGARLHQKVFDARMLYWADKMGYMVWDEFPNWGLSIADGNGLLGFMNEWREVVERDYSSPAVIGWCPFNETELASNLYLLETAYFMTKSLDATRPVIDTSGWVHSDETDIFDYHDYEQDPETFRKHVEVFASAEAGKPFPQVPGLYPYLNRKGRDIMSKGQPIFISEFGGIGWNTQNVEANAWGYGNNPKTEEEFMDRLEGQMRAVLETEGICGFCYTQLTDVEQEINGLYTYEREPKFDVEKFRERITLKAWCE